MPTETELQINDAIDEIIYQSAVVAAMGMTMSRCTSEKEGMLVTNQWMNAVISLRDTIELQFELIGSMETDEH
jgi:hypothetical protein